MIKTIFSHSFMSVVCKTKNEVKHFIKKMYPCDEVVLCTCHYSVTAHFVCSHSYRLTVSSE